MTDTATRPRGRDELVFRQLDDEWVVYDPRTERLHVLNRVAAVVWLHCTGELTVGEIAGKVREAFDGEVDPADIDRDVRNTVGSFDEKGLLA